MGTADFAVPVFEKLVSSKIHQVVSLFTGLSKAKGRGLKTSTLSTLHRRALEQNIPVFTPHSLETAEIQTLINTTSAEIIVVVAYGLMIPREILTAKKYGCLNIHPSDLPKYRGAAPLQHTIINDERQTAVSIIQMDEGWDSGAILLKHCFDLPPRITLPDLHDQCASIGADLLIKVLDQIEVLPKISQAQVGISYAKKLRKAQGRINWQHSAYQIDCQVRAMNPWPGSYFEYQGTLIKILVADYRLLEHSIFPGTIISDQLEIACGTGILIVKKLQQAGKASLTSAEFLRGWPLSCGDRLQS